MGRWFLRVLGIAFAGLLILTMNNCDQVSDSLSKTQQPSSLEESDIKGTDQDGGDLDNNNGGGYTGSIPFKDTSFYSSLPEPTCTNLTVLSSTLDYNKSTDLFDVEINNCQGLVESSVPIQSVWNRDYVPHFLFYGNRVWYTSLIPLTYELPLKFDDLCFSDSSQIGLAVKYQYNADSSVSHSIYMLGVSDQESINGIPGLEVESVEYSESPAGNKVFTSLNDVRLEIDPVSGKGHFEYKNGRGQVEVNCMFNQF